MKGRVSPNLEEVLPRRYSALSLLRSQKTANVGGLRICSFNTHMQQAHILACTNSHACCLDPVSSTSVTRTGSPESGGHSASCYRDCLPMRLCPLPWQEFLVSPALGPARGLECRVSAASFCLLLLGCIRPQIAGKVVYCTAVVVQTGPQKEEAGRGQLLCPEPSSGGSIPFPIPACALGRARTEHLSPSWV